MSFRARLTLFFVLIVIVPMVSVAIVLFRLIGDSETGKVDASLAADQRVARQVYADAGARAAAAVPGVARALVPPLRAGDRAAARAGARAAVRSGRVARVTVLQGGRLVVAAGDATSVAPAAREVVDPSGRRLGRFEVSVERAAAYAARVRAMTGLDAAVARHGRVVASTVRGARAPAPGQAHLVHVGSATFRAVSFDAAGGVRVVLLTPDSRRTRAIRRSFAVAGGILLGFLLLALVFALVVSRSLQAEIGALMRAARRLGEGDFGATLPTDGRDEFAALGREFQKMSEQLSVRVDELRQERGRLAASMRRVGEAFASNLDRDALIELVLVAAVDGTGAEGGRLQPRGTTAGDPAGLEPALAAAEALAQEVGAPREAHVDGVHAAAHPLRAVPGTVAVARRDRPFTESEHELLGYLVAQAAVSLENVGLHEAVARQAVTDELTGLFNHRRFQEALESETERARRFEQPLSLVMLDIDDFKAVNDAYGHQQGDRVLAEVARVLRATSREIDSPARYGGEELAVVLPQTDLEGAFQLAERIRAGIEDLRLPLPGDRRALRVTASIGVAALPEHAETPRELIARADAALYEAKRGGKNRTVRA